MFMTVKYGVVGRRCCAGDVPNDVGWFCGSDDCWGSQVAAKHARRICTDHPGKRVTRGICLDGPSREEGGCNIMPPGEGPSSTF